MASSITSIRYVCCAEIRICGIMNVVLDGLFRRRGTIDGVRISSSASVAPP